MVRTTPHVVTIIIPNLQTGDGGAEKTHKAHTKTLAQHPGNVTSEPALVTSTCNYLHLDAQFKMRLSPLPPPDNETDAARIWILRGLHFLMSKVA